MNFEQTPEFKKDIKALAKRVPTIQSDVKRVRSKVEALYIKSPEYNLAEYRKQFFASKKAAILPGSTDEIEIIKMRLDTDSPQYRQKLRIVFVAIRQNDKILLVELYSKNNKSREDSSRIKKYTK